MTGLEIALMLGAAGKAGQGIMTGVSQIDRLSPEQKNRMKELERNQALGLLGLDEAQQQRILNQQLQPVQAAEREAFSRQAQQQQIADIGQGAAFRGQQALLEASGRARAEATQRAQDVITERDALEEAAQLRELDRIKAQRQMNLQAAGQIAGGVGDAALMGLGTSMAMKEAQGLEDKMLKAASEKQEQSIGKKTGASGEYVGFIQSFTEPIVEVPETDFNPLATAAQIPAPAAPVQQVASVNNPALDAMVAEGRATPAEAEMIKQMLGMQVTMPRVGALINFGGEGPTSYGYKIEAIDPLTGLPSSVRWYKDGTLTEAVFEPGSEQYAEAKTQGGW
jgi:hypothetical protein